MSGNGPRTAGTRVTAALQRTARPGPAEIALSVSSAAVHGKTSQRTSARPAAGGTAHRTGSTIPGSVWPGRFNPFPLLRRSGVSRAAFFGKLILDQFLFLITPRSGFAMFLAPRAATRGRVCSDDGRSFGNFRLFTPARFRAGGHRPCVRGRSIPRIDRWPAHPLSPRPPRRFLEQQPTEPPLGQPQQGEARPPSVRGRAERSTNRNNNNGFRVASTLHLWARAASSPRTGGRARSASRTLHDERARIDIGAVNIPPPSCRAYGPGRWRALPWVLRRRTKLRDQAMSSPRIRLGPMTAMGCVSSDRRAARPAGSIQS